MSQCSTASLSRCLTVCFAASLFNYPVPLCLTAPMIHCFAVSMSYCLTDPPPDFPIVHQCTTNATLLPHCLRALTFSLLYCMPHWSTAPLLHSSSASLPHWTTEPLPGCHIFTLANCLIIRQNHCLKGTVKRILTGVNTMLKKSVLVNWRPAHFSFRILKGHHHKRNIKPISAA